MSKLLAFAGSLLLVLVIGVTASNSGTAVSPLQQQSSTTYKQILVSLKNQYVSLQLAIDKPAISLMLLEVGDDYIRLATGIGRDGRFITPNYYVPFSNILYVRNDTLLRGGQVVQTYTIALK